MSGSWLCKHTPRPQASARLFCFSWAGVGASVYRQWPAYLPVTLEICPVQLPGREQRFREVPLKSIHALVDALMPALLPDMDLPFAFFGHSMGAVIASELARALVAAGHTPPEHLLVSGRRPTSVTCSEPPFHMLPDAEFIAEINRRYGGIPAEVMAHADLMALLLPCLRADITALETHCPPRRPALGCPVSAFGGLQDRLTPLAHLEAWRCETSAAFGLHTYPGGHFYINQHRAKLLADVGATLAPMLEIPRRLSANA